MKAKRFDNIDISHPGPINCPFDKERGFKTEIETEAISSLLEDLNCKDRLFLYLNYHSTGGMIYQRPAISPKILDISSEEISKNEKINYILSQAYSSRTYKNIGADADGRDKRDKTKYIIKTEINSASSTNDIFRLKYPQNLLIELSGMGGNPIAPYGDIKGNYTNAIESNLDAVKFTLHVASLLRAMCEEFTQKIKVLKGQDDYDVVTSVEERYL